MDGSLCGRSLKRLSLVLTFASGSSRNMMCCNGSAIFSFLQLVLVLADHFLFYVNEV